ncbi:MAG: twin-arginine translocation pathway signal [Gammaproteobacteria bacterium]|nr:twin-arginine translocation pathway signal [Gammaproteobacteria bacterium]
MPATNLHRRSFLALAIVAATQPTAVFSQGQDRPVFLSAASDSDSQHWVKAFSINDNQLEMLYSHRLPERAHAVALHPNQQSFVTLARRPGTFMLIGDVQSGEVLQEVDAVPDRHFYGHGVFSADGEYFYTTENAYDDTHGDNGRIGVWRYNNTSGTMQRVDEFYSYGVGPHELLLMPDQDTLVIANGGIRTHPDSERDKLNIDIMRPNLVYIDRHRGSLLEIHSLPAEYHQASIRHIDVNASAQVAIAMQFEGEPFMRVPLLATHRRGEAIRTLMAPEQVQSRLQQYVGSIRFDHSGRFFVASCPRANLLTFWDAENGEFISQLRARDACGVCAYADGFVFSTGTGRIAYYDLLNDQLEDIGEEQQLRGLFWDNHLVVA